MKVEFVYSFKELVEKSSSMDEEYDTLQLHIGSQTSFEPEYLHIVIMHTIASMPYKDLLYIAKFMDKHDDFDEAYLITMKVLEHITTGVSVIDIIHAVLPLYYNLKDQKRIVKYTN